MAHLILQKILNHYDSIVLLLLSLSAFLFFLSVIGRLKEIRELVLGFRRMQSVVFELERTVNELQAEVRRTIILAAAHPGSQISEVAANTEPAAQEGVTSNFNNSGSVEDTTISTLPDLKILAEASKPATFASGLSKSRTGIFDRIKSLFTGSVLKPEAFDDLEAQLIAADLGPKVVARIRASVEQEAKTGNVVEEVRLRELFSSEIEKIFQDAAVASSLEDRIENPLVMLIVGVNGVGKTTTTAKIGKRFKDKGKKVLLVAADTFRAGAVEQLKIWGERLDIAVCAGAENAKPQTVVFEAAERAVKEAFEVVIIDTAGRLHNKANLMQELEGIRNAISRHIPGAPHEALLVIDGTTGQNALMQAKEFNETVALTGLVVTKLDGTAKGGVVAAVTDVVKVPIRYVGLGEKAGDLVTFDAHQFARALFIEEEAA